MPRKPTSPQLKNPRRTKASRRVPDEIACTFPDCGRKHLARGYCKQHYQQLRAGKELTPIRVYRRRSKLTTKKPAKERWKQTPVAELSQEAAEARRKSDRQRQETHRLRTALAEVYDLSEEEMAALPEVDLDMVGKVLQHEFHTANHWGRRKDAARLLIGIYGGVWKLEGGGGGLRSVDAIEIPALVDEADPDVLDVPADFGKLTVPGEELLEQRMAAVAEAVEKERADAAGEVVDEAKLSPALKREIEAIRQADPRLAAAVVKAGVKKLSTVRALKAAINPAAFERDDPVIVTKDTLPPGPEEPVAVD